MACTMTVDGPCRRTLSFTIDRSELEEAVEERVANIARTTAFKGFRAGKAPIAMVRRTHGAAALEEARRQVMGRAFSEAVKEHELLPVGEPEMNLEKLEDEEGKPLTFEFALEVAPEIELKVPEQLRVDIALAEINEEMIDGEVNRIREQGASLEDAEEGAAAGEEDILEGTATYTIDGEALEPRGERAVFLKHELVDAIQAPGSREVFLGAKVGETVNIDVELPPHFEPKDHAGKAANLDFAVERIRKVKLADFDEEFLKRLGVEDEADLRKRISEGLAQQRAQSGQQQVDRGLEDLLLEAHEFELPERLLAKNIDRRVHEHAHQLMERGGMSSEEGHQKAEEQRSEIAEASARGLKLAFIYNRIAKQQDIVPTIEDAVTQVRSVAAAQNADPEQSVAAALKEGWIADVQEQLAHEKAREWLRERTVVTETEPKLAETADTEQS
ncbi:MAG: trigger factor [Planctomycetota bacterium]|nr:MAG: trigger factor [Planctomycetota bacterium]